jgi:hypothetical protein
MALGLGGNMALDEEKICPDVSEGRRLCADTCGSVVNVAVVGIEVGRSRVSCFPFRTQNARESELFWRSSTDYFVPNQPDRAM